MGSHRFENSRIQYKNVTRMAAQEESAIIRLVSCDNKEFSKEIVIPDVTGDILKRVIDFCLVLFSF